MAASDRMQEPNHSPLEPPDGNRSPSRSLGWSWQGLPTVPGTSANEDPGARHRAVTRADLAGMREIPDTVRLPIERKPRVREKLVCFTSYHGAPKWIAAFHPHLKSWASRNSIDLRISRNPPAKSPFKKSLVGDWLDSFLGGPGEWMMVVDAGVMIHPQAPNPLTPDLAHGFRAMEQPAQEEIRANWARWVRENFQREVHPDYRYRNDGVWMADRATASKWREHAGQLMIPGDNESFYFNLWLHDAVAAGTIELRDLPEEWNRLPHQAPAVSNIPAWFYHCPGRDKLRELGDLYLDGFLPQPKPAITIKPWPEEPELEHLIAIPYHLESDPSNGECLRHALRSIERYWKHDWPLKVFGTERPEWLDESVFEHEPSYPQALLKSCSRAQRVLWMNDDILFLKDTTGEDLRIPLRLGDLVPELPRMLHEENRWTRARAHITGRLHHENGMDVIRDFSAHVGYLFERSHARRTFDHFGVWHKFPMELAYHGLLGSEGRPCDEKATWETRDDPSMRWLNVDDSWIPDEAFVQWMTGRFPHASKWESGRS